MSKLNEKEIFKGLTLQRHDDGDWLCFEINGKKANINIQSKFSNTRIIKSTLEEWFDESIST